MLSAGDRPDGLYIVLAGHFDVRRGGHARRARPRRSRRRDRAVVGQPVKSDIVARGKALALCLPASEFREMIMTHPHVLEYIGEQAEHSRKLQIL